MIESIDTLLDLFHVQNNGARNLRCRLADAEECLDIISQTLKQFRIDLCISNKNKMGLALRTDYT